MACFKGGEFGRQRPCRGTRNIAYGTMYGVKRTTIYLTDTQKLALEEIADATRCSEAELIRDGVDRVIESNRPTRRKPGPLFALDDPLLDDPQRVDEALEGFGE